MPRLSRLLASTPARFALAAALLAPGLGLAPWTATRAQAAPEAETFAATDKIFADYALDTHTPGLIYGIVMGGRLVHVGAYGVQALPDRRPVTADTLFRIASMSKAFTALEILKLRDAGKLRLDEPAETYVPELRGWTYPTADSPRIRVRDLLNHTAGFVTDNPWGDRQQSLPEAAFTALLRQSVPFARPPESEMEYANMGYAILGRIITNVSGRPYAQAIEQDLLKPLGMADTGYEAGAAPAARRAQGYTWDDTAGAWTPVETMPHGAFGAMGGVQTSATDYAKWIAFLLSAWPARDDAETGPARRATVREMAQGSNFPVLAPPRPNAVGAETCRRAATYGMGLSALVDCELGFVLGHSGGYPGYGSFMLLLPKQGVGVFAFTNRTYNSASRPVYEAASRLKKDGFLKETSVPPSAALAAAYRTAGAIYAAGDAGVAGPGLAMNFLMDRSLPAWRQKLADLRKQVGACETASPIGPTHALAGRFTWRCERGRVEGDLLLAPSREPQIQSLDLDAKTGP